MIQKVFHYGSLMDDDRVTLHTERVLMPEGTYHSFQKIIADNSRSDATTEAVVHNILSHGGVRHDGPNGEPAVEVNHFNDAGALEMYRAAGADALDEQEAPIPVLHMHYTRGENVCSIQYDHSGQVETVYFGSKTHKHFNNNFTDPAAALLVTMRDITHKPGGRFVDYDHALRLAS